MLTSGRRHWTTDMRASFTFFRVAGISIGAHSSWLLVLVLVTWSLAAGFFPAEYPGWPGGAYWLVGAATAALFFGSVLLHELAHSLVAQREGIPVRSITLFIFGGVSQISREPPSAGAEFRIAAAGPLASLALGALCWLIGPALGGAPLLAAPVLYLARMNGLLGVFNLLPGFPLDGGRVLRAAIWARGGNFRTATRWASTTGHALALLFVLRGVSELFAGRVVDGVWIAFLGWFLNTAAEASYQQAVLSELLSGVTAKDLMGEPVLYVPAGVPLDVLVHQYLMLHGAPTLFVEDGGLPVGLITLATLKTIPRARWATVTAADAMTPLPSAPQASPDDNVVALVGRMSETGAEQLPVMAAGRLLGVVTRDHLLRYIRTRTELQS